MRGMKEDGGRDSGIKWNEGGELAGAVLLFLVTRVFLRY